MYLRRVKVYAGPYAQYTSNIEMTVCTTENNRIAHFYYQHVSQSCAEAKSVPI